MAGAWPVTGADRPGRPLRHPEIHVPRRRVAGLRSEKPLDVHADGEVYLRPGDGVRELTVELLPRRLRVKVCDPGASLP